MLLDRTRRRALLTALVALLVALPACSDNDDPAGPGGGQETYVGTWDATSFSGGGMDLIAMGMTLEATFTTSTYSLTVTNDQVELCGGTATSCTTNGPLSATASEITIDAGEPDAVTFDYTVTGSTMTWSGDIDGTAVTITWALDG